MWKQGDVILYQKQYYVVSKKTDRVSKGGDSDYPIYQCLDQKGHTIKVDSFDAIIKYDSKNPDIYLTLQELRLPIDLFP